MTVEAILREIQQHSEQVRRRYSLQHDVQSNADGDLARLCVAILERDQSKDPFSQDSVKWRRLMALPYPAALLRCATLLVHELQRVRSDDEYRGR